MTERIRLDDLTDDQLDQLYTERDMLGREGDRLRKDWVEMRTRAEKAERAVEHLADRYRGAEAEIDRMKILVAASSEDGQAVRMAGRFAEKANEQRTRAEQAEAAIERVRALHSPVQYGKQAICGHCSGYGGGSCDSGPQPHPCPTIAALDATG